MRHGTGQGPAPWHSGQHSGNHGNHTGKTHPGDSGAGCDGQSGKEHLGIIELPVPILKADQEKIREIREQLYRPEYADLVVVDFSDVAQSCNVYEEYIKKAASVAEEEMTYFGIGICGARKLVNKLTGSLPLLR